MLTLARRQPIAPQVTDVDTIITSVEQVLRRLVSPLRLKLELAAAEPIYADPQQIEQVLINLLQNARDATTPPGALTIRSATRIVAAENVHQLPPGYYVELEVHDQGSGIAPELLPRAFEPFFSTKGSRGRGLGLATCYSIISQHGGAISIDSRPGQGTTVQVLLPITNLKIEETPLDDVRPGGRNELVLLVEDQPAVRDLVLRILSDLGYRVVTAGDGREALRLLGGADLSPDVLLTDVVMPNLSGIDLAAQLRTERPELPVLLMSGYADGRNAEMIEVLLAQPRTARIHKPFAVALLAQQLRKILD